MYSHRAHAAGSQYKKKRHLYNREVEFSSKYHCLCVLGRQGSGLRMRQLESCIHGKDNSRKSFLVVITIRDLDPDPIQWP